MNLDCLIEERLEYAEERMRLLQIQMQAEAEIRHRERRERIAKAALHGLLANPNVDPWRDKVAVDAVILADALIAELDKEVQP